MSDFVNIGAVANDRTGDVLRTAFGKVNTLARQIIIGWADAGNYSGTFGYDSDGAPETTAITWPDGSAGVYTPTVKNTTDPSLVDAYTITHVDSALTITQPEVTRDEDGRISVQPALTAA